MDPDRCLREILEAFGELTRGNEDVREDAVEKLRALAHWLSRGGFPPDPSKLKGGVP